MPCAKSLKVNQNISKTNYEASIILSSQGDINGALVHARLALKEAQASLDALLQYGNLLIQVDSYAEALDIGRQALAMSVSEAADGENCHTKTQLYDSHTLIWLAQYYLGNFDDALESALESNKYDSGGIWNVRATLTALSRFDECLTTFGFSFAGLASGYMVIAHDLFEDGRFQEAAVFCARRMAMFPDSPDDFRILRFYLICLIMSEDYRTPRIVASYWSAKNFFKSKEARLWLTFTAALSAHLSQDTDGTQRHLKTLLESANIAKLRKTFSRNYSSESFLHLAMKFIDDVAETQPK